MVVNKHESTLWHAFWKVLFKIVMELTNGIFKATEQIYKNNKGSILRTIIYTLGHFAIAITVLMLVADVSFGIALTDAIVEPIANSVWYFILDKWWASKSKS